MVVNGCTVTINLCPYINGIIIHISSTCVHMSIYMYISHQHVPDVYTVHVHMFLMLNVTVKD